MVVFDLPDFPTLYFPWYNRMPAHLWHILRKFVHNRDNGECQYCGAPVKLEEFHCHHVLPLSEGGTNHPSNLKTLCKSCHKKRHPFMLNPLQRLES